MNREENSVVNAIKSGGGGGLKSSNHNFNKSNNNDEDRKISSQFFLMTIICIIFDVKIALLLPILVTITTSNIKHDYQSSLCSYLFLITGMYHE